MTETSDLNLAAFSMVAYRMELKDLKRLDSNKAIFVFDKELRSLEKDFWNNRPIPVQDFIQAQKFLKRRLFS